MNRPKVFLDADALFAGSVSTTGAAHLLLKLSELSLLDGVTSEQAVTEAKRNLQGKLPESVPDFEELVAAAVQVSPDSLSEELQPYAE
jgi:hypothetical protein